MATIEKRGPGQFRAIVRRKGYPTLRHTFGTRQQADAWARQHETQMDRAAWVDTTEANRTTLGEALSRYAREVTPAKRGALQELGRIKAWQATHLAQRSLASIRGADLAAWRDSRLSQVGPNTVRLELAIISHLFTIARKEWGMEGLANPVQSIRKPPAPPGRDARITRPQEDAILAKLRPPYRQAVIIALETAMRRGELSGLRWQDVDLERRTVRLHTSKNGSARQVPLSTRAMAAFRELRLGVCRIDAQVFGEPAATADYLTHAFQDAARAAGGHGVTFHTCRHEATRRLFEAGLGLMEVAAITGHKTLAMLRRYTHLRAEDLARKLG